MSREATWVPVEGKGAVHSYTEVHHAIQPAFKAHTPYLILLVDLDTQKGKPTEHEALRVVGNLVTPDGKLAPPEMVKTVGIGTRVRMVFTDVAPGPRAAAVDHRRERHAARQAVALSAGVSGRDAGPSAIPPTQVLATPILPKLEHGKDRDRCAERPVPEAEMVLMGVVEEKRGSQQPQPTG